MLLIIEGPDCSGKTTLADAIVGTLAIEGTIRLNYGPPDPPDGNPFLEYEAEFLKKLPADPGTLVIADRLAAGELVYGPLLRGQSRLSSGGLLHCEMLYEALGAVRIMMMPALHIILGRMRMRGDDLIDVEDSAYIHERYAWIAPRYGYRQLSDMPSEGRIMSLIQEMQDKSAESRIIQAAVPGYIGTLAPKVVLAGDVRAGNPEEDPYLHAFTPAARGAARFLMDGLAPHSRAVIRNMGILNTGEPGMNLEVAGKLLGNPAWVALGSVAAGRLAKAGFTDCEKMPHPSWVMRFTGEPAEQYGRDIMSLPGVARMVTT